MNINLTPTEVLAAFGVCLALILMWRAGTRSARRAVDRALAGARVVSLTGRVLLTAAAIVGVQWIVITKAPNSPLFWVVLALPALLAGYVITRALTVTSLDTVRRRGGGYR